VASDGGGFNVLPEYLFRVGLDQWPGPMLMHVCLSFLGLGLGTGEEKGSALWRSEKRTELFKSCLFSQVRMVVGTISVAELLTE